jgi:hypothetical protein
MHAFTTGCGTWKKYSQLFPLLCNVALQRLAALQQSAVVTAALAADAAAVAGCSSRHRRTQRLTDLTP